MQVLLRRVSCVYLIKFNVYLMSPVPPVFLASSSAEQWKTIELPVNKTVPANVLEIMSPTLFYAIPSEMPGEEPYWWMHACAAEL